MGFLKQEVPVIDFETWSRGTRAEKIKPMAKHWAEVGFGTPIALHLFYVVKILLYIFVAALFALATKGATLNLHMYADAYENHARNLEAEKPVLVQGRVIRGTDGARLSFMGLPTPNLFTGGNNFHSKHEWIALEDMEKAAEVLIHLLQVWAKK